MVTTVAVSVCTDDGWVTVTGQVADDAPDRCYAILRTKCRREFWIRELGSQTLPEGSILIWEVVK